jgi:hypothetical protein
MVSLDLLSDVTDLRVLAFGFEGQYSAKASPSEINKVWIVGRKTIIKRKTTACKQLSLFFQPRVAYGVA